MDTYQVVGSVESENIPDSFVCCVCQDLLYKPIVLFCGHISCFWCVHKSMNGLGESRCPLCRNPYNHFPTICQMLHFLLEKMYPIAYKRREKQILEEEKKTGYFSPQFDCKACGSHNDQGHDHLEGLSCCSSVAAESHSCSGPCFFRKEKPCDSMEQTRCLPLIQDTGMHVLNQVSDEHCKTTKSGSVEKKNGHQHEHIGSCKQISIVDVQCAACKQLLCRPVALNCGHVYCETCIMCPLDEMIRCQVCQSVHPRGIPKVCLELDHFLEEQFPGDYILRRDAVQLKQMHFKNESLTTTFLTGTSPKCFLSSPAPNEEYLPWWANPHSKAHMGVGCDYCGVYPIIGNRYRCKDCVEKIGFDLCGDCYNTRSKLPGRFNQQHTSEHKFELVNLDNSNMMLSLAALQLNGVSAALVSYSSGSEELENEPPTSTLSDDAAESTGNILSAPVTQTEDEEDQNGSESTG